MKPFIIVKNTDAEGEIHFTQEEIRKIIEEAYNQGYSDGYTANGNQKIYNPNTSDPCPSHYIPYAPQTWCNSKDNTTADNKSEQIAFTWSDK